METYDWDVLIKMWETERMTDVQVIGQLLLHGKAAADLLWSLKVTMANLERQTKTLAERLTALEKRLTALEKRQRRQ